MFKIEVKRVPTETALLRHGRTGAGGEQPPQVPTAAAPGLRPGEGALVVTSCVSTKEFLMLRSNCGKYRA